MREKIAEKLYSILYNNPSKHNMKEFSRHLADQILSLPVEGFEVKVQTSDHPNGYAIETRPLTLGELLKKAPILIKIAQWANDENDKDCIEFFNCPADESWCKESNCPIDDALTFNGSRIVKKSIPSSDEADRRKFGGGEMSTSEQKRRDGRQSPEERSAKVTITICHIGCEHYNPVTDRTKESCPYRIREAYPKVKKVWI